MLNNKNYVERAPRELVEKEREKLAKNKSLKDKIVAAIEAL